MLPYANLACTIVLAVVIGLVISSAFSAILVYATDLMPGKVGMIAGYFRTDVRAGGLGSAFFRLAGGQNQHRVYFSDQYVVAFAGCNNGLSAQYRIEENQ